MEESPLSHRGGGGGRGRGAVQLQQKEEVRLASVMSVRGPGWNLDMVFL